MTQEDVDARHKACARAGRRPDPCAGHDECNTGRLREPQSKPREQAKPFPWREAIGFGLGMLQLSPEQFWRMTPRELALAFEARLGRTPTPFARETFTQLMKRYPDGR
jgi:uncharacterized phage protein (TIGR02216 family)